MRVAHIVDSFSPLTETFIYDTIVESVRQGVDAHVITNARLNTEARPFEPVYITQPQPKWHPQRVLSRFKTTLKLQESDEYIASILFDNYKTLLQHIKPDVIHAHFGNMGWYVLPVAKLLKIPLVVSFHGYDAFLLPNDPVWRRQYSNLFAYANSILVVSQIMRQPLISLGSPSSKLHVVHVGKRIEEYPVKPPSESIRNWLSVGRLVEKKGHDDCIRAFARLSDLPGTQLTIVGEGPLQSQLQQMIENYGLEDKVKLVYGLTHETVKKLMRSSDGFILCSKTATNGDSEGIPTVLMEAQATGLPCVSTKHSGIPECIPVENHWLLAKEGDVEQIEKLIRQVTTLDSHALANVITTGRLKVEKEFELSSVTEAMILTYRTNQKILE